MSPVITGGKIIEKSRPWLRNNATVGTGPFSSATAPAALALANIAQPGALLFTLDTGVVYENTGTLAAPVWTSRGSLI